jgi:hypothetical protein
VVQDKVADGVGTLNGVCIAVEGIQKPMVMFGDEFSGACISPELILTG